VNVGGCAVLVKVIVGEKVAVFVLVIVGVIV